MEQKATKTISPNVPIKLTGPSRANVKQQLDELYKAAGDKLEPQGGFIEYHQGLPGEPDIFKSTVIFTQKTV